MAQNLCGYSQEEIVEMLKAIKKICENNECDECPIGIGADCRICEHTPQHWDVGLSPVWRAFL